jgi:hypothetical protein
VASHIKWLLIIAVEAIMLEVPRGGRQSDNMLLERCESRELRQVWCLCVLICLLSAACRLPAKAMVADESDTPADSPDSATSKRFRSDDSGDEAAGGSHMVQGDNVEGSKQQQQQQADEVFPSSISEPGDVPTGEQQRTSDRSSSEHSQDARRPGMSTAVLDGMAALDAYFSGNSEAANALVKEFLRQRRRRMAISSRQSEAAVSVALPILWGRRHHYTTSVALVKRTPAKQ